MSRLTSVTARFGLTAIAALVALLAPWGAAAAPGASAASATAATAATSDDEEPPKLLGRITVDQLDQQPYVAWFREGHDDYTPDRAVLRALRRQATGETQIDVFFGTWCGDSRREVPRLVKLLDEMDFPAAQLRLIAVDNAEPMHKRSPGGQEAGLEVYRVPTVIVRRDGREVNRLVEHPQQSLERDLLSILEGRPYREAYLSYPVVRDWLAEGLLSDGNVSARGLAGALRPMLAGEGELAAAGRVMLYRGDVTEAVKLFQVNCSLYRDSPGCHARLADALLRHGDLDEAREAAERAVRLTDDPEQAAELVELIERIAAATPEPATGAETPTGE